MATIDFPSELPAAIREGYNTNHVSPFKRTGMASGRAKQRRTFTSVPTMADVTWRLSEYEARVFEAWFRYDVNDGTDWFNTTLKTPMGYQPYECRFADIYEGPRLTDEDFWTVRAQLEIRERQILTKDWYEYGRFALTDADIIDTALNREWPAA